MSASIKLFSDVAQAAFIAMARHLQYLSEELVALALFSPNVEAEVKREMLVAMATVGGTQHRRASIAMSDTASLSLPQLCTSNTAQFFETLGLSSSFLNEDPECWEDLTDFQVAKDCLKAFRAVNDIAERTIKLMEDFNEEQKQFLLQVVANHRQ